MGMRWALGASRFISRNYRWISGTGGVLMATIGILLITGIWVRLLAPVRRMPDWDRLAGSSEWTCT